MTFKVLIRLAEHQGRLHVHSPYSKAFTTRARKLNGLWSPETKTWHFSLDKEQQVRRTLKDVYGWDEHATPELCTVQLTVTPETILNKHTLTIAGATILSRVRRNYSVWLGDNVRIISGNFPEAAGSPQYPLIMGVGAQPVVIHVQKFPVDAVSTIPPRFNPIVVTAPPNIDIAALRAERERLTHRISEIDKKIASAVHPTIQTEAA
ncbi:hypothetical protein [Corynebacterium suranareeae]|uniref:hypothetical protein n=1 Tax=Corynebacterium suranareeae TaxID=2506452 RepID=UPI001E35D1D9|nr:hypothetical protein [Corynebacterium suranareeae]